MLSEAGKLQTEQSKPRSSVGRLTSPYYQHEDKCIWSARVPMFQDVLQPKTSGTALGLKSNIS